LAGIEVVATDLTDSYRSGLFPHLAHVMLVADPFHVIRVANRCLDKIRRRVQNETLGHRGRKDDPLFKIRKLMLTGAERLDEKGTARMLLGLRAGDPNDEVLGGWLAKESARDVYLTSDRAEAGLLLDKLIAGCAIDDVPEIRSLGQTLARWRGEILAYHDTGASSGPTEGLNLCVKKVNPISVYRPLEARCWMVRDRRVSTGETRDVGRPGGWRCESSEFKGATGLWMAPPWTSSWRTATCRIWRRERSRR
jgi:transposase